MRYLYATWFWLFLAFVCFAGIFFIESAVIKIMTFTGFLLNIFNTYFEYQDEYNKERLEK